MNSSLENAKQVFLEAIEICTPDQWPSYLEEVCGDNQQLRRRVELLLKAHAGEESLLDSPAIASTATVDLPPISETVGSVIGPYQLMEQIGEGGMGVVYVAQQEKPVRRKVALKIIKPGMDTKQVIARFEAERQALAMMNHPNIAKILDVGATEKGQPYFAMELVRGLPITKYCDKKKLNTRERLELFIQVCKAVQHAHQKGIIHRDLKPTNILITLIDASPVPKVIDFGVAKAVNQQLTDHSVYTAHTQMIGTPMYMSPEQAEMTNQDVDTRSDVYSLGVLLYELLTGSTPFDKETLKQAGFDEMRRIIREEEPLRPSDRISTLHAEALSAISAQRNIDAHRFSRQVQGELDWIAMRALEKDRTRRYESASAFAADIERHLNDEPVQACPPSVLYVLRKYASKHRTAAVMSVMAFLLIVAVAASGFLVAKQAQEKADSDRQFVQNQFEVNQQIKVSLTELQRLKKEAEIADLDDTESWAAVLQAAERSKTLIEHELASPQLVTRVTDALATLDKVDTDRRMVKRLDDIRLKQAAVDTTNDSFPSRQAILEYKTAFDAYEIAVETLTIKQATQRLQNCSPLLRHSLIAGMDHWYQLEKKHGKNSAESKQRCDWLIDVISEADSDPWRNQAREAIKKQDFDALRSLAQTVDVTRQPAQTLIAVASHLHRNQKDHQATIAMLKRARMHYPNDFWINLMLGRIFRSTKPPQYAQSIRYCTAAVSLRPRSASPWTRLGIALEENGEPDEAIAAHHKAIAVQPDFAEAYCNLGAALSQTGKHDEAIASYHKAIELNPDYAGAYNNLGFSLKLTGKIDEAIAACRKAIALQPDLALAYLNLGNALISKGKLDESIAVFRQAIALQPDHAPAHNNLGIALVNKGKIDESIASFRNYFGTAINEDGDIVGYRVDGGNASALFYRWDTVLQAYSGLDLGIPVGSSIGFRWAHINNRAAGEVQIVTTAGSRLTLSPDLISNSETDVLVEDVGDRFSIRRINDSGTFCGTRDGNGLKGKKRSEMPHFVGRTTRMGSL